MDSESGAEGAADPPTALRSVADVVDTLLSDMHQPPNTGSPYSVDLDAIRGAFVEDEQDVGMTMIHSTVNHAGRYIAYVSKGARDLAMMIDKGATVTIAPVVRSHVEYAARAWWLVEPLDGVVEASARDRVIRLNLDLFTSVCYRRFTLKAAGSPDAASAKQSRKDEAARIRHRYGMDSSISWSGPGDEGRFDAGGVRYEGLTAISKRFLNSIPAEHGVGNGSSAYDALAGYSHPSPLFLQEMLTWVTLDDRTLYHWDVDSDFVARLASYSEAACWHAAASLAKYLDRWEPAAM